MLAAQRFARQRTERADISVEPTRSVIKSATVCNDTGQFPLPEMLLTGFPRGADEATALSAAIRGSERR